MRIALAALGILVAVGASRIPGAPKPTDFAVFYSAAKYFGQVDIYSLSEFARPLQELGFDPHPFIRLPVFALLIKPLTVVPFGTALVIWRVLAFFACIGFVMLWPGDRRTSAIAVFWSVPLWDAYAAGQDIPFFLLFAALALYLMERNRYWSAGVLVSACAMKFHLFILFPLLLGEKRQWRTASAACMGVLFQLAVSTWQMPGWFSCFAASASSDPANALTHNMFNFRGILSGFPYPLASEVAASAVLAIACWRIMRRSDLRMSMAVMLVGSLMMSHHAYLYDALLCLPLALLIFRESENEAARVVALLVMAPPVYLLASIPILAHVPKFLVLALLALTYRERVATCRGGAVAPRI